jgi:hypothetical protein
MEYTLVLSPSVPAMGMDPLASFGFL